MTMNSVYYKEQNDGSGSNTIGSLSSGSGPWWSGLVTQPTFEESGRVKPSSMENHNLTGGQLAPITPKHSDHDAGQVFDKRDHRTQFKIFTSDCKNLSNGQKSAQIQASFSMQSAGHPAVICGKYPYGDHGYGVFSTYGPQIGDLFHGRIMLPLNLSSDDGPIFVNAKQYHGIIRRRRSRAKAQMANKVLKSRKPYLHLSRHLHAMRRPRGCGGRFLNKGKSGNTDLKKNENPSGSPNSDVLLADHSNLTSPREPTDNGSHAMHSEVNNMFNRFPIGNLSVVSLSEMMMSGNIRRGFGMHDNWVAVTSVDGGRCNLAV